MDLRGRRKTFKCHNSQQRLRERKKKKPMLFSNQTRNKMKKARSMMKEYNKQLSMMMDNKHFRRKVFIQ